MTLLQHTPRRLLTAAVAVLLVVGPLAVLPLQATGQGGVTTVDSDHPLATDRALSEFEETGNTSGSVVAPSLRLSIGQRYNEETNRVLGNPNLSPAFVYFRVQYNETLPRTIRIHIPAGYWHPFPSNIQAENGPTEASFRPAENGSHTVVTLHVENQTDAVFQVPLVASKTYVARDLSRQVWENATGIEVPRLGSAEEWRYLNRTALVGSNTTVGIAVEQREAIIQYDAAPGEPQRWLAVPDCESTLNSDVSVCRFQRAGDQGTVYLLARERFDADSNPPPTVRYKFAEDSMTGGVSLGGIVDGVAVTFQRAIGFFQSLVGGQG